VHPVPETLNCTVATLLFIFTCAVLGVKFAVTVLGAFITTESGFAVPLASPDQLENW
jgi:hypothetical protein